MEKKAGESILKRVVALSEAVFDDSSEDQQLFSSLAKIGTAKTPVASWHT
jgi:hypothetical protein